MGAVGVGTVVCPGGDLDGGVNDGVAGHCLYGGQFGVEVGEAEVVRLDIDAGPDRQLEFLMADYMHLLLLNRLGDYP